jgi:UDP-N-acetyl-2-amino-2-deoxyglucuronate dehydrogenase
MASASKKIRVGLVGCGRISASHINAIQNLSGQAELSAVCDIDPTRLHEAAEKTGATPYSSIEQLLAESAIDVISLCTPSGIHPEQGILAARAGKHVITEKPMAVRWPDGVNLVKACNEAGVKLFVVKQNRLNPTIQFIKTALDQGRLGRLHTVTSNVFWTRPQDYYDQAKWRGTWAMDGGAFMNQASHYVDMMTYLGGPIARVAAITATQARKIEAEDSGVATFQYASGAVGSMNVTMLSYPKNIEGSITLLGDRGSIRVGGVALNRIEIFHLADSRPEDEAVRSVNYEPTSVYGNGHQPYYESVLATLRGERDAPVDGRAGLVSLQTLIAIYRSASENRFVDLPLEGWPSNPR